LLNIKKILLPLDLQETTLPTTLIRQAAGLAHHFHSEILVLHVVKPSTYMAGSEAARELLEQAVASEQEKLKSCLGSEINGSLVKRMVLRGDAAREIGRTAHNENVDLIVIPTHGYGAIERFLLGSVTVKVLHDSECLVWTGAHIEDVPGQPFAIRKVLCAVDFGPHSARTIQCAQDVATAFGAELTLAHATPGVEIYGPGGYHVLSEMKRELVGSATKQMAKFQQELSTKAAVVIGSGDVPKTLSQIAKQMNADLLVIGRRPSHGRLRASGYAIICESRIPVLSV
jgi:nucleotide-binding universal stress UspA family protein